MEAFSFGALLAAFFGGVLAFFSPCMLPVFPGLLSFLGITGNTSETREQKTKNWLLIAMMFVLGLPLAMTALGAGVGALAELLTPAITSVQRLLGAGLILMGVLAILLETGWIGNIPLLRTLVYERGLKQQADERSRNWGAPMRALAVGAGFGLAWTPCVGPFLGAIMTYAVSTGDMGGTTALFLAFSVGMSTVFLLAAAGAAKLFARLGRFARIVAIGSGIVLILLGLMFLLGFTDEVSRALLRWVPDLGRLIGF